jgi:hypothetical protein
MGMPEKAAARVVFLSRPAARSSGTNLIIDALTKSA